MPKRKYLVTSDGLVVRVWVNRHYVLRPWRRRGGETWWSLSTFTTYEAACHYIAECEYAASLAVPYLSES